jgi:hypothetical protein
MLRAEIDLHRCADSAIGFAIFAKTNRRIHKGLSGNEGSFCVSAQKKKMRKCGGLTNTVSVPDMNADWRVSDSALKRATKCSRFGENEAAAVLNWVQAGITRI